MLRSVYFQMFSRVRLCSNPGLSVRGTPVLCRHQTTSTSSQTEPASVKVLYDGVCPICVVEIRFLQFLQKNRAEKVDFVDISLPDYDGAKYSDISYEMAMEKMHVIDDKNEVHSGVPAFAVMYSAVGLSWLGRFMMWPWMRPLMEKSYAVFAKNRLKWTGRGDECTTGRCVKKTH